VLCSRLRRRASRRCTNWPSACAWEIQIDIMQEVTVCPVLGGLSPRTSRNGQVTQSFKRACRLQMHANVLRGMLMAQQVGSSAGPTADLIAARGKQLLPCLQAPWKLYTLVPARLSARSHYSG
jgi:hypothetical protein